MKRATSFKALLIAIFVLPGVACSAPATSSRAPRIADPPGGIMDRDEYEHSGSYPQG